jgi:hypothetical protein
VEYENLVVSHAFLSHNNFLATVDDEVAALIILTVLASSNAIILTQTVKLTELRSEHDRDLANHHSGRGILCDYMLNLALPLPGLRIDLILVPVEFLLREGDVDKELSGISQVPHTGLMWVHSTILVIFLGYTRALVDTGLAELDLPDDEFVGVLGWLV